MRDLPKPGEIYRHFKGRLYQIIGIATETEHEETVVVYQALYGSFGLFVRPLDMFMDEIDRSRYPAANQRYRFEKAKPRKAKKTDFEMEVFEGEAFEREPFEREPYEREASRGDGFERKALGREVLEREELGNKGATNIDDIPIYREDDDIRIAPRVSKTFPTDRQRNAYINDGKPLIRFLDAIGYEDKKEVLKECKDKLTQRDLDSIYMALGITGFGGDELQQVEALVSYLDVQKRYEGDRLRGR